MVKNNIVDALDNVINNVVQNFAERVLPVANNKKEVVIGKYLICSTKDGYCVKNMSSKRVVYDKLCLIESAFLLAKNIKINRVLELEKDYTKHYTDMVFYINSFKSALLNKDFQRAEIMEDRFIIASDNIKRIKTCIRKIDKTLQKKDKY